MSIQNDGGAIGWYHLWYRLYRGGVRRIAFCFALAVCRSVGNSGSFACFFKRFPSHSSSYGNAELGLVTGFLAVQAGWARGLGVRGGEGCVNSSLGFVLLSYDVFLMG